MKKQFSTMNTAFSHASATAPAQFTMSSFAGEYALELIIMGAEFAVPVFHLRICQM